MSEIPLAAQQLEAWHASNRATIETLTAARRDRDIAERERDELQSRINNLEQG